MKALIKQLDECLPQTQCGECGYAGCLPYAEAMAAKAAPINRCPPGGEATLRKLAELLGADPELELIQRREPSMAVIREPECIGCTKCIQACPVDAIIGSAKQMHAVLSHECTGCGLCIEPCPVDCIEMQALPEAQYQPEKARARYQARKLRLQRDLQSQQMLYREKRQLVADNADKQVDQKAKQAYILEALARVKAKQGGA